jgi:steroid delta-isomerase-like uncharacterized protein
MSTEVNRALARRIVEEMWNTRNLDVIDEIYAPSSDGHEDTKQFVSAYLAAFPDLHITIVDQIAEADQVTTRYTTKGTHLGQLADIPPTGEQFAVEGIEIHRFAAGMLVELWNSLDPATGLQQLRVAANRALARRWYDEFINAHDVDALDDLLASDFASHFLSGAAGRGRDDLKQIDGAMFSAVPDLRVTVQDMVAEGDKVAVRYASQGTHTGDDLGVPATGREFTGTAMDIFRIADGKIAERWAELDFTGFLRQIGAFPE